MKSFVPDKTFSLERIHITFVETIRKFTVRAKSENSPTGQRRSFCVSIGEYLGRPAF